MKRAAAQRADIAGIAEADAHVDLTRVVAGISPSAAKDRHDQAENDADDNAGDDGKIKRAVFALDPNVARQTA
jgi:hypothetical protein